MISFQDESILEPLEDGLNALLNIEVSGTVYPWFCRNVISLFVSYLSDGNAGRVLILPEA